MALEGDHLVFAAALLGFGLCGLFVGGMNLYERAEYRFDGRPADMELADPRLIGKLPPDPGLNVVDVRYHVTDGELLVRNKRLFGAVAKRVLEGERVPVTFLRHEPQRALAEGEELDNPWGWLVAGLLGMGAFAYAVVLMRRER